MLEYLTVQCRITGFDYVAAGNSTNKKDAQTNAAKDMVQYLVRTGRLSASEVPEFMDVCIDCLLHLCFCETACDGRPLCEKNWISFGMKMPSYSR